MKKIIFILSVFLFISIITYGQTYTNDPLKIPNYAVPSPEVAAFTKYGDVPVSEYSGTSEISIPLYTVKLGSLSIPITLSYHASGIQVSQEATWVGLGWNLMAGGCISYTPVGGNDQIDSTFVPWSDRKKLLDYIETGVGAPFNAGFGHEDIYYGWTGIGCYSPPLGTDDPKCTPATMYTGLNGGGQLDIYNVNFLNYSFKFYMHSNTPVVIGKKTKCKVIKQGGSFLITGEDGTKYWFAKTEHQSLYSAITAWLLSWIITPDGQEIYLNYDNSEDPQKNLPTLSERCIYNYPEGIAYDPIKRDVSGGSLIYNQYLSSIETKNEKVMFDLSDRDDYTAKKLSSIRVIDKLNNQEIKRYNFSYDYFVGSDVGGDYMDDDTWNTFSTYSDNIKRKRLKLEKVTQYDADSTKGEEYTFDYNDSLQLPLKTSFARDFWGYYNGQENTSSLMPKNAGHTIIPNIIDLALTDNQYNSIPEDYLNYKGANRGTSTNYITTWMLKAIHYPTGGKTKFQFEPHSFTNQKYLSAEDINNLFTSYNLQVCYNKMSATTSNNIKNFTLEKDTTKLHLEGTVLGAGSIVIVNLSNGKTYGYSGTDKTWKVDIKLAAGNYKLICSGESKNSYDCTASATLSYSALNESVLTNAVSIGGGVRVKRITNYDTNNTITSDKQYFYSGGKIQIPLSYFKSQYLVAYLSGKTGSKTYFLSGDSYNLPASVYAGNDVGYDTVKVVNYNGNHTIGKEITTFQNTLPKNTLSGYHVYEFDYTNGDALSKVYLNAINDTVRKEEMVYEQGEKDREFINYFIEDNYVGNTSLCQGDDFIQYIKGYIGRYNIIEYSNTAVWSYLKSKIETDYLDGSKVTKTTEFSYNSDNYCISEQKETNSDSKTHYTQFTYPVDYTETPYSTMQSYNILNPVIEKSEYYGTTLKQAIKTTYTNFGSNALGYPLFKPSIIMMKTGTNDYKNRVCFNKYDSIGNPLYLTKDDSEKTVYIWGYNKQYPVAKIQGTTYDELKAALGGTIPDLGSRALTNAQISTLRNNLPAAFVTTYTYKPLVGILTATASNGVTTYYEYDTFNRLKRTYIIEDGTEKTIQSYDYHYQGQ
jgi:hypothetical protein